MGVTSVRTRLDTAIVGIIYQILALPADDMDRLLSGTGIISLENPRESATLGMLH
jgi:hypothetical protein